MQDVLADLERWQAEGEEIAVATLVRAWGSAPRPPGARFAVTRSGRTAGSVSGGCVEGDLFERSQTALATGERAVVHYGIADEMAFQVGLSCGGSIELLLEPFRPDAAWQAARQALAEKRPVALATGLAPQALLGRRLALLARLGGLADESLVGGLDPALDGAVAAEARKLLVDGGSRFVTLPWQGGEAALFVEGFVPTPRLIVAGATHVAIPLCRMAKELGYRTTVVDARSLFATRERFPDVDELLLAWPDEVLDESRLDAYAYVVVLTHDPKFDLPTLARALRSPARYIGVIGSQVTHEHRVQRLREQGFQEEELARLRAPIGLDLGARTPEETALAILAEMTALRYQRDARPLTEKRGHIHPRPPSGADRAAEVRRVAVRARPSPAP